MNRRPDRSEFAEYYATYIDQAVGEDINGILATQEREAIATLSAITEDRSLYRYAPGKWSIRETVSHMTDAERAFVFRAFWFARGLEGPLPSFDQNVAVAHADADSISLADHVAEFAAVRGATRQFFLHLRDDAWSRTGVASGNQFTVRALAYITAGHVAHHLRVLKESCL